MSRFKIIVSGINLSKKGSKILQNISFELKSGNSYLLYGKNGAGKSSLIRCLTGMEQGVDGEIKHQREVDFEIKKTILPEIIDVPGEISVDKYIESFVRIFRKQDRYKEGFHKYLNKELEIDSFRRKAFSELSKGMIKRVFISIALMAESDFLIFDEPFEGIDVLLKEKIIELLSDQAKREKIVFLSTHELSLIENRFDYYIGLKKGNISRIVSKKENLNYQQLLADI